MYKIFLEHWVQEETWFILVYWCLILFRTNVAICGISLIFGQVRHVEPVTVTTHPTSRVVYWMCF